MTHHRTAAAAAVLLAAILVSAWAGANALSGPPSQSADELYQAALMKKEAEGDLEGAIELFRGVIAKYPGNAGVSAKAQLQIGLCFEKLGRSEAIKAYELVVERYSGQREQVAAARARLAELKKEPPKGLSITKLGGWDKPGMFIQPMEMSSDGASFVGVEFIRGQNIVVYDIASERVREITDNTWNMQGYSYAYNPTLSPDGREIAFFSSYTGREVDAAEHSLFVATLDGKSRILAKDKKEWYAPMGWLPDGSAVLAIKGGTTETGELGLVPRQGGAFRKLASFQSGKRSLGAESASASISPDGRFVAYTDAAAGEKTDIWVVGSQGGRPEPLLKHPAEDKMPRWSPDGTHIVFLSLRHGSWALWGVAVKDGRAAGEPFLIKDGMKDSALMNWTGGGLAAWERVSMRDIYLMDVDPTSGEPTSDPHQLEYTPTGANGIPIWSPDGRSFAFIKIVPGTSGSIVVFTGSEKKESQIPAASGMASLKWSPDGKAIGTILADENKKWSLYAFDVGSGTWAKTPAPVNSNTLFDWGGDSKILFLHKPGTPEMGGGIVEWNTETGAERYIHRPDKDVVSIVRWMDSSWDHGRLAFLEVNAAADGFNLKVIDLASGEIHVASRNFGPFAWSPDGRSLVGDLAFSPKGPWQSLFIVPGSGGPAKEIDLSKKLPPRSTIGSLDWSPDGRRLIFQLNSSTSEVSLYKNLIPPDK
jgi:Tol biopolymer transport system component